MNTQLEKVSHSAAEVGKLYDQIANSYAKANSTQNSTLRESADQFARRLPGTAHILDLGCGSGRDAMVLSDLGFSVVGVDPSGELLKHAVETGNCRFVKSGFLEFRCPSATFDGVWASASLLHFSSRDLNAALKKVRRILRPSGVFFATFKEGFGESAELDKYEGKVVLPVTRHSLKALVSRYENAGLKVIEKRAEGGWLQILAARGE